MFTQKFLFLFFYIALFFVCSLSYANVDEDIAKRRADYARWTEEWRNAKTSGDIQRKKQIDLIRTSIQQDVVDLEFRRTISHFPSVPNPNNLPVPYDPNHPNVIKERKSLNKSVRPSQVVDYLKKGGKGVGGNLIALILYEMLGKSVDYVLDPDNNRVLINPSKCNINQDYFDFGNSHQYVCRALYNTSSLSEKPQLIQTYQDYSVYMTVCQGSIQQSYTCGASQKVDLDEIARRIMSKAKDNHKPSQKVIEDIVLDQYKKGDYDEEIVSDEGWRPIDKEEEDAQTSPEPNPNSDETGGKEGDTSDKTLPGNKADDKTKPNDKSDDKPDDKKDPETGAGGGSNFELPAFCDWAKHVCDFIDWMKEPPDIEEPDPYKPEITDLSHMAEQDINKSYYNADGQCPAPTAVKLTYGTVYIRYDGFCAFAVRISPLVVALAYVLGAYIIARGKT